MTEVEVRFPRYFDLGFSILGRYILKFVRALNNNAGIAIDDDGRDVVVFGKGLAFSLSSGDAVPTDRIERLFREKDATLLESLLKDIPQCHFETARECIDYIQNNLSIELAPSIYVALMDHISFIQERAIKGMLPSNALTWEISQYYPTEFHLGQKVVELLEDELECPLNDDEAASIALHIINAENNLGNMQGGLQSIELIDDIIRIIEFQAGIKLDSRSLSFQRLIAHVKFFLQRIQAHDGSQTETAKLDIDSVLSPTVRQSYPQSWTIANKIKAFVGSRIDAAIAEDETAYLAIHIQRVIQEGGPAHNHSDA